MLKTAPFRNKVAQWCRAWFVNAPDAPQTETAFHSLPAKSGWSFRPSLCTFMLASPAEFDPCSVNGP